MGRAQLLSRIYSCRLPSLLHSAAQGALFGSQELGPFGVRKLRTVEVVLTETIEKLGRAGQVVKVAPGYARNKLIPQHLALPALGKYVTLVNNQIKMARPHLLEVKVDVPSTDNASEQKKLEEIETALRRLDTGKVVLRRDVSSLNNLQKGVTKEDIIFEARRQLGVELAPSNIMLNTEFTILGEFEVLLRFPKGAKLPGGKEQLYLKVRSEEIAQLVDSSSLCPMNFHQRCSSF